MVGSIKHGIARVAKGRKEKWQEVVQRMLLVYRRRPLKDGSLPFQMLNDTEPTTTPTDPGHLTKASTVGYKSMEILTLLGTRAPRPDAQR